MAILIRHALKKALLPFITVAVFNLNGIGKRFVEAIRQRDYTMIQSLVLLKTAPRL